MTHYSYRKPFELCCGEINLRGGFCLDSASFEYLNSAADLFLHPKEKAYLKNLKHPRRQKSFLLGRYCAKQAVACNIIDNALTDILIENGIFQQPVVYHPYYSNIQVSISHTDLFGAALSFPETHPMAIDIETMCETKMTVMQTQMTSDERKLSSAFSGNELALTTLLWTAKESLSKVLKCGCMIPFELLEVETLRDSDHFIMCYFKNFHQYQALSFPLFDNFCSIVYPKKTELKLELPCQFFNQKVSEMNEFQKKSVCLVGI